MCLRDSLQRKAAESKSAEDVEKYQRQRDKVEKLDGQSMAEYFRRHPQQEGFWLPLLAMEAAR